MHQKRTLFILSVSVAALASACKGGGDDPGAQFEPPPVILSTVDGEFAAEGTVVEDSCDGGVGDRLDLDIRMAQVATGLSVLVDYDVGWVPCDGSIEAFDCRWGNAPADTPAGTWRWSLVGTTDGDRFDAVLGLDVTCEAGGLCEPCTLKAEISGTLE